MPIPDYQSLMLPLLASLGDGRERSIQDVTESLSRTLGLTDQERAEMLPSGQPVFRNRLHWSKLYLKNAGLLTSPRRAWVKITDSGSKVLAEKPSRIDVAFLKQLPPFVAFLERKPEPKGVNVEDDENPRTPFEELESAYGRIQHELENDILEQVKAMSPHFFERMVVDLLVKMGYGGNFRDAAHAVGGSRDGGIDGIIKEDKLGLDTIYLQAKRWANTVGRPEIQQFAGALQGRRARKGVFITTSSFSDDAVKFAMGIEKIVLLDGTDVARLMIEYDLGVSRIESYDVKKIDSDYFSE
jgi:restriction system protein